MSERPTSAACLGRVADRGSGPTSDLVAFRYIVIRFGRTDQPAQTSKPPWCASVQRADDGLASQLLARVAWRATLEQRAAQKPFRRTIEPRTVRPIVIEPGSRLFDRPIRRKHDTACELVDRKMPRRDSHLVENRDRAVEDAAVPS